nr:MAG TPA: hypothetical protein [Caudoviricetes sp.]
MPRFQRMDCTIKSPYGASKCVRFDACRARCWTRLGGLWHLTQI